MDRKTVLLVDDEESLRLLVRATLGSEGFELLEASDGVEALAIARASHPDLVLLDVGMPGMDGYAVCRALKSDPATNSVKVIMLTARAQLTDRQLGTQSGVDVYMTKPFSPTQLVTTVYTLLDT